MANNLVFILQNIEAPAKRRQLTQIFKDALSPIDQDYFVIELLHSRVVHDSYIHSLNILSHYTLDGEIMIDHLRNNKSSTALGIYLAATPRK